MGFNQNSTFGFGSNGGGGGGGTVTGANDGLSLSGTVAQLGQVFGNIANPAALTENREIPMGTSFVLLTNTSPGLGGFKVGSSPLNTSGLNETSTWTLPPMVTLGGGKPTLSFNIDDYQTISSQPWGTGTIVWRSANPNMPTMTPSLWGANAGAGFEFHYATTDPSGANYTSAMEFWLGYIDGTTGVILGMYGKGIHFAGTRANPSIEVPFCINIGQQWTDYAGFASTSGSFNLDANNAPINFWNMAANPAYVTASDSAMIVKSNGNVYVANFNATAIASVLTGYTSGAGVIAATDSILSAIQKLNGNIAALVTGVSSVTSSDSSLTVNPTTGAVVAVINPAHTNTFTVVQNVTKNSLGATTADALLLQNTTAAILGTQQASPALHFSGRGFNETASASQNVDIQIYALPQQGLTPLGIFNIQTSINGGAYATMFSIDSNTIISTNGGTMSVVTGSSTTGQITLGLAVNSIGAGYYQTVSGGGFVSNTVPASGATVIHVGLAPGTNVVSTSGTVTVVDFTSGFAPTSSGGFFNVTQIAPIINQTGGASGVTRGIYINPVLTSAADWRAIEIITGKSIFQTVGIGGLNPTGDGFLQIPAPTTSTGQILFTPSSAVDVSSPTNGLLWYNGTNLYFYNGSVNKDLLIGAISSVSNSDGTLTISPTTGAVVASLALTHANTWTGVQTFNPTLTAAAGLAQAHVITSTLSAAANNDILVALDINPTFTNGAFSNVTDAAIRVAGKIIPAADGTYDLGQSGATSRRFNNGFIINFFTGAVRSIGNSGGLFIQNSGGGDIAQFIDATGNMIIQNGGVFTDSNASLQIGANTTTNAQLLFTTSAGTNVTSPTSGMLWWNGTNLYFYNGSINIDLLANGVTSVSNSDSSLTISPTTGAVVASLNIAHANTWTALQTINIANSLNTFVDGFILENTTAATSVNTSQNPPSIHIIGQAWNTTALSSQTTDFRIVSSSASGNPVKNSMAFQYRVNGGAYTTILNLNPSVANPVNNSDGSITVNQSVLIGTYTVSLNTSNSNTFTAVQNILKTSLGTSTVDALLLENTTAATNGAQQVSPALHFSAQGFETNTSASQAVDFRLYLLPIQGAANPFAQLLIQSSINGGAYTTVFDVDQGGNIGAATWQGSLITGTYGGTGVNNGSNTITIAGNLVTTGAFNTTFVQGATATITLPISSSTLLANNLGISGGSTLIGDTASGGNLTLQSTSNATKGKVYIGAAQTSYFDEANINLTLVNNGITSVTDALIVKNTTAATNGTQQLSGAIHFIGQGFETNSSASQTVDYRIYLNPVQSILHPVGQLIFASQVNAGGYTTQMILDSAGALTLTGSLKTSNMGINVNPTTSAFIFIAANSTTESQINFSPSAAVNVSSPNNGDLWWNGTNLFFRTGSSTVDLLAGPSGGVSSVTNGDGTLTISPTTGSVVASLALAHVNTWTGAQTFNAGKFILAAGTASNGPLSFTASGAVLLTTPVQGTGEIDSNGLLYYTVEGTAGRGLVPSEQHFRLTSNGSTISTIANFFGTTSNITLVANAEYIIEIEMYYTNTTSGTVTWTFTNSAAPTLQNIYCKFSPAAGIVAPAGSASAAYLEGNIQGNSTAAEALSASPTLTTATTQYAYFKFYLINGTGTSLKIQATKSAGTITPLAGSYWRCLRLPASNVGIFAA